MRPAVVLTIAVLLLAILGAAALQFVVLAPSGDGNPDTESGLSVLVLDDTALDNAALDLARFG